MPLELTIPRATRIPVQLTGGPVVHPTAGYRRWRGQFTAAEPIVALAITVSGDRMSWTRTSHRGMPSLETSILFAPYDEAGLHIRVSFSIFDATAIGQTCVDSIHVLPAPRLQRFQTGELVDIATITTAPACELKALFLLRSEVASVHNGVWHARGNVVSTLSDPWRTILTYGRTGELEVA